MEAEIAPCRFNEELRCMLLHFMPQQYVVREQNSSAANIFYRGGQYMQLLFVQQSRPTNHTLYATSVLRVSDVKDSLKSDVSAAEIEGMR